MKTNENGRPESSDRVPGLTRGRETVKVIDGRDERSRHSTGPPAIWLCLEETRPRGANLRGRKSIPCQRDADPYLG